MAKYLFDYHNELLLWSAYYLNFALSGLNLQKERSIKNKYHDIPPIMFCFRHGFELFLKSFNLQINKIHNLNDLSIIFKKIKFSNQMIGKISKYYKLDEKITQIAWNESLPKKIIHYVNKFQQHSYFFENLEDFKNENFRYPKEEDIVDKINKLKKSEIKVLENDIKDLYLTVIMILHYFRYINRSLVFEIKPQLKN